MHKEKNNNYNHYGPDLQLCKLEPLSVDANVTSYSSYVLVFMNDTEKKNFREQQRVRTLSP